MTGLCILHIVSSEYVLTAKSRGEVLLFLRKTAAVREHHVDEEATLSNQPYVQAGEIEPSSAQGQNLTRGLQRQQSSFYWENVHYSIPVGKTTKHILTDVDGFIKPGTLTALMGATGAGKTTLLDVLSQRTSVGTVSGRICVDGRPRDDDFQRMTGYAQQHDVHLDTSTVREALEFSALLRQPPNLHKDQKLAYVDEVLTVLEMETFADAIVGELGLGLNVEQRKRLTIGIELAAKPELLLFLDEPTSGLDSQTAWTICSLLKKLADNGQAILCTIHQPSSTLLHMFDRLLLIGEEGRTIYFGNIGDHAQTLRSYFDRMGARPCAPGENPAEWMMEVTGPQSSIDWYQAWSASKERRDLADQIRELSAQAEEDNNTTQQDVTRQEFATSFSYQFYHLVRRNFVEYWRTPAFLWAKFLFTCGASLVIAFSCWKSPSSLQGLQSQLFAIFVFFTIFSNIMQQIVPQFINRRALFEARERPSHTFSWKAFLLSAMITEAICQALLSALAFALFYYPMGFFMEQPSDQRVERGALMFLFFLSFFLFTSTFSHLLAVGMEHRETIVNIGSLLFYLILIFCGVLVPYEKLPKFWTFMYWMSPLTYFIRGMFSTGVANKPIMCSDIELFEIPLPKGMTCGEYLQPLMQSSGGTVLDPNSEYRCQFCPLRDTNTLLQKFNIRYSDRWQDLGIIVVFIIFNTVATFFVYWLSRVPKRQKVK